MKEHVKECKFTDGENVICMAVGCLENQEQQFFYSRIDALDKCWQVHISCRRLCWKATKPGAHLLWI